MYLVCLTGGIGSGKTTVSRIFYQEHQIENVCADKCARDVIKLPFVVSQIVSKFGYNLVNSTGDIRRNLLRQIITESTNDRLWINDLMHPIIQDMLIKRALNTKSPYTIIQIPLISLDSLKYYPYIKKIITVKSSLEMQIGRIMLRDQLKYKKSLSIIKTQISDEERLSFSSFVIDNRKDISGLAEKIKLLHKRLMIASME